ncbi:DUF1800 domain-containing protein [bacterium]|nr:DUF1800 domain-containing protein [bacterium]
MEKCSHLMRRAGFGLAHFEVDDYLPLSHGQRVRRLIAELQDPAPAEPADFDPYQPGAPEQVWLTRMLSGRWRLAEKISLFWHGHFATSNRKVSDPGLMWRQYCLFRKSGAGHFSTLLKGVSRDVAMLLWLDGNSNRASCPNENYARELLELFTLGVGHYQEKDVREAARAFSGWSCERGRFVFRPEHHDSGQKTFLGHTGPLGGDDIIDILCAHPGCAEFVCAKLLRFFASSNPSEAYLKRLCRVFAASQGDLGKTLEALFNDSEFLDGYASLVKSPVEFLVTALRALGQSQVPHWAFGRLWGMGQALFYPPSVKGWDGGAAWLSGGALVERMHAADRLARLTGIPDKTLALACDGRSTELSLAWVLASPQFQLN